MPDVSLENRLEEFLRFGLYPKVITSVSEEDKQNYLYEFISNYLHKDVLSFETVRKPKKIIDLLSLLALIRNFNPLSIRSDAGALFENFCIIERFKAFANARRFAKFYFWRTYDKQEIDLIEEHEGNLFGYEFKWSAKKMLSAPPDFINTYPNAHFFVINPQNCFDLITKV